MLAAAAGIKSAAMNDFQHVLATAERHLLTLKAADSMDRYGNKVARDLIAAIKVVAPQMAQNVTDRAIQIHGGMGVSDDTPIAYHFTLNRFLRIADGPDEVHMSQLGKLKIAEYNMLKPTPYEVKTN